MGWKASAGMRGLLVPIVFAAATALSSCGGGGGGGGGSAPPTPNATDSVTIAGTITGLSAAGLVLSNGADRISLAANATTFSFPTKVAVGSGYSIGIVSQPAGLTCTVNFGDGTATSDTANASLPAVVCSAALHELTGSVVNLAGNNQTGNYLILNNGATQVQVAAGSTTFKFPSALPVGTAYQIQIFQQPQGQVCSVQNGKGTIGNADTTGISIVCRLLSVRVTDGNGLLHSFTLGLDGSLTPAGTIAAGNGAFAIVGTPDKSHVFVSNADDNTVSRYTIAADGSILSAGAATPVGTNPLDLAISPSGQFLYVAATGDSQIKVFAIDGGGGLTSVASTTTPLEVTKMVITPNGKFLFYLGFDLSYVQGYAINSDGSLTALSQGSFSPTTSSYSSLAASFDSSSLYLAGDNDSQLLQLAIGADGTLSTLTPATVPAQPGQVRAIATFENFFVELATPVISPYTRASDGLLTPNVPVNTGYSSPVFSDLQLTPKASSADVYMILVDSVSGSVERVTIDLFGQSNGDPVTGPISVGTRAARALIQ